MSVEIVEWMGSDLSIVNAARVSFAKYSDEMTDADRGLIGYLARNRHGTPFEMVQFKFRVRVPIGVAREWQRHRIGSFNEVSTRYVEMKPDFYVPEGQAVREQIGKPGHYQMVTIADEARIQVVDNLFRAAYEASHYAYSRLIDCGVAKEVARNVLPLGLYTEFIWGVNLRSLFNFLSLRTAPSALYEIRVEAAEVEAHVQGIVPVAYAAWCEGGRMPL